MRSVLMDIQRGLYKIYIFLLPFLLLPGLSTIKNSISQSATIENDLFILFIGVAIYVISNHGVIPFERDYLYADAVKTCLSLVLLSLATSLVLYPFLGKLNGENTITATIPNDIYMIVTALAFYYNAQMFRRITKREICRVLDVLYIVVLVVGYMQVLTIYVPMFGVIYDNIDVLDILVNSSQIANMNRTCLVGSEPSSGGDILSVLLIPYVLSRIITGEEKLRFTRILLMLPLVFFTYSSTVYAGFAVNLLIFYMYYTKTRNASDANRNKLILTVLLLLILGVGGTWFLSSTAIGKEVYYYLFAKTQVHGSMSTEIRYSTLYTDIYAFLHYPLTGVGNGNQGFFYNEVVTKYLSSSTLSYFEMADRLNGSKGIVNGGAFVPAFISGFGLIGIIILFRYILRCKRRIENHSDLYGSFKYMYYIGGLSFLAISVVSGSLDGNFLPIFVLSIPFMENISLRDIMMED